MRLIKAIILCVIFGLISGCSLLPCEVQYVTSGNDEYETCRAKESADIQEGLKKAAKALISLQDKFKFDLKNSQSTKTVGEVMAEMQAIK